NSSSSRPMAQLGETAKNILTRPHDPAQRMLLQLLLNYTGDQDTDHPVELIQSLLHLCLRALVVTRGKRVAGVVADRDSLVVVERVQHLADLFEPCSYAAAKTGIVFD